MFVFLCLFFSLVLAEITILPLGVRGGVFIEDLSSYAVSSSKDKHCGWVLLDAGTVLDGLNSANQRGYLDSLLCSTITYDSFASRPLEFLQDQIKNYFISHGHFDHLSGLVINSVEDTETKNIIGLKSTIDVIDQDIFNGKAWVNFGPSGLKKYSYVVANETNQWSPVSGTPLNYQVFPVYHEYPTLSTAFWLSDGTDQVLYFGDVGPDSIENAKIPAGDNARRNATIHVWEKVADSIIAGTLNTIFIECSFSNAKPDNLLFGHLTPKWLTVALNDLQAVVKSVSPNSTIKGINIVVTHIKPILGKDVIETITKELKAANTLGVNFIFPSQATPFVVSGKVVTFPRISAWFWVTSNLPVVISASVVIFVLLLAGIIFFTIKRSKPQHKYAEIEPDERD